jgi:hypothetical protein
LFDSGTESFEVGCFCGVSHFCFIVSVHCFQKALHFGSVSQTPCE